MLYWAVKEGHALVVDRILSLSSAKSDFSISPDILLLAVSYGHLDIVRRLLLDLRVDPTYRQSRSLYLSFRTKRLDIARILVQDGRVDASIMCDNHVDLLNQALGFVRASEEVNIDDTCLLVSAFHANPTFDDFVIACHSGTADIVRSLLAHPVIDPSVKNNMPLRLSSFLGHSEVVKVLLVDHRVDPSADGAAYYGDMRRRIEKDDISGAVKVIIADEPRQSYHEPNFASRPVRSWQHYFYSSCTFWPFGHRSIVIAR